MPQARSTGLISPWSELWEQYFEYELQPVAGGVRARTSKAAVSEDFAISGRRDPALLRSVRGEHDPVEARALVREAFRRRRVGLAALLLADALRAQRARKIASS